MSNTLKKETYIGERCLFHEHDLYLEDCVFEDGESPLKESKNINLFKCTFKWKYPLWYSKNLQLDQCELTYTARSGIWYTDNIYIKNSVISSPKTFRRSSHITVENSSLPNAEETLWNCDHVRLINVKAKGDYLLMNSKNIYIDQLYLDGNYVFDGGENIEVHNSTLNSKDSFWNCKHVVVYDSIINGEYLGWNSEDITFINCKISSLQGMCYMKNLRMINCTLIDTTLCFEYSTVEAEISSSIDSVKNPLSGIIKAKEIKELILDENYIDPKNVTIITEK